MGAMLGVVSVHLDTNGTRLEGISDIEITVVDGVPILLIGSEAESAVTSFTLEHPVNPDQISQIDYSEDSGTRVLSNLETYSRNGESFVVATGRFDDNYGIYRIDGEGSLTFSESLQDDSGRFSQGMVTEMVDTGSYRFLATAKFGSSGLQLFRYEEDGSFVALKPNFKRTTNSFDDISAMDSGHAFGETVLIVASAIDAGLNVVRFESSARLSSPTHYLPDQGTGFSLISDLDLFEAHGKTWLLVAASESHSVHVLRMASNFSLKETDSYIDTAETRFAGVTCMETFTYEDRTFVVVAGRDEGVTLFELDYRGKLVFLDVITDDFDTTLANVSDMAIHMRDNLAFIYVGSSQDHGYTVLKFDMERSGDVISGNKYSNKNLQGTAKDDLIWGKEGHDKLFGNGGDDRLVDGFGRDKMTGGWGDDVFAFIPDSKKDWILDFQPGKDKIDLSEYDHLWDISSLYFNERANGSVVIFVGQDKIHVVPAAGEVISETSFVQDDFIFG